MCCGGTLTASFYQTTTVYYLSAWRCFIPSSAPVITPLRRLTLPALPLISTRHDFYCAHYTRIPRFVAPVPQALETGRLYTRVYISIASWRIRHWAKESETSCVNI